MDMFNFNHQFSGTVQPYVFAAGTLLIGKSPSDANGGGCNIREAMLLGVAGTVTINLLDMGASGTVNGGTILTLTYAQATRAPLRVTPSGGGYFLDGGNYLGLEYGAGTATLPGQVTVIATMGR